MYRRLFRTARVFRWSKSSLADGATVSYEITVTGAKTGEGLLLAEASSNTADSALANNVVTREIRVIPTGCQVPWAGWSPPTDRAGRPAWGRDNHWREAPRPGFP